MVLTIMMALLPTAAASEETRKVTSFFSSDYRQARTKFVAAAKNAGAKLHEYKHPKRAPNGEPLYTDVAILGPKDARNVLVIISGTHGVEGLCGSAVQTGLLERGLARQLPNGVRAVLVHAINPYGFAWLRRFNEDNVDLNRNFVDHDKEHPTNCEYDKLAEAIAPKDCSEKAFEQALARLEDYGKRHGKKALQDAITRGQYKHPKGLHYGGRGPVWSNTLLRKIVKQHISPATRVVLIPNTQCKVPTSLFFLLCK